MDVCKKLFFEMCLKCLKLLDYRECLTFRNAKGWDEQVARRKIWLKVKNAEISEVCLAYGYDSDYLKIDFAEKFDYDGWSSDLEFCNFYKGGNSAEYILLRRGKSKTVIACRVEAINYYSSYLVWVRDCGFLSCNKKTGVMTDLIKSRSCTFKKLSVPLERCDYAEGFNDYEDDSFECCLKRKEERKIVIYKLRLPKNESTKLDATFLSLFGLDVNYENVIMPFWSTPPVFLNSSKPRYILTDVVKNISKMAGFYVKPIHIHNLSCSYLEGKSCGYLIAQSKKVFEKYYAKEIREAKEGVDIK